MKFSLSAFALLSATLLSMIGGTTGCERELVSLPDGEGGAPSLPPAGDSGGAGGETGDGDGDAAEKPAPPECPQSEQGYASEVVSFEFGEGQNHGQDDFPEAVLGGPVGGGCCAGSLDVTSLGDGGWAVLGFGERTIENGPGPDFIVFENPFWVGGDPEIPLAELGTVAVSVDGEEWVDFPCEGGEGPSYGQCAGWRPVLSNVISGGESHFEVEKSGGDPFDLADVALDEARYVRVTDLAGDDVVFDLDSVAVVNGRCD